MEARKAEINLEGYRYSGKFRIEEHINTSRVRVDTEFAWHWGTSINRGYGGEGIIKDNHNQTEQRFLIYPNGLEASHLVIISEEAKGRVQDSKKVIDYALSWMYDAAKRSNEIIPKIKPPILDL